MKGYITGLFLFVFLLVQIDTSGQGIRRFSGDLASYPAEVANHMGANLKDTDEEVIKNFTAAWNNGVFDEAEKQRILALSVGMLEKKARGVPHFRDYWSCMLTIREKLDVASYVNWEKGVNDIVSDRRTSLNLLGRMFEHSLEVLNNGNLYRSNSVVWSAYPFNFKYVYTDKLWIEVEECTLVAHAKRDSMHIFRTRGLLNPMDNTWLGKGGVVTWERAGYETNKVSARLTDYSINLTRSEYSADSVFFRHTGYLDQELAGRLEDKVMVIQNPASAIYPRFESYFKRFRIKEIYKSVNYEGGFSMQGSRFIGAGSQEEPAGLFFYRRDTLVMKAQSNYLVFDPERVAGNRVAITILLEQDSIYHGDLSLVYSVANREIRLLRTDNFSSQGPYYNSYHGLDMNFEQLVWKIDEPLIYFTTTRGTMLGRANFESRNFFNRQRLNRIQGMDTENPLYALNRFSNRVKTDVFTAEEFAGYLRKDVHQVRLLLMRLTAEGFIFFNSNTDEVVVRPKLVDYLRANAGNIDFDVINFESNTTAPLENARLDTRNYDLLVNGVPAINISDSQNVAIYPRGDRITIKRNRDFQFDGRIDAGLITIHGQNFYFDYENFKVNLQNIDSLRLRFVSDRVDNFGIPIIEEVTSTIEHITGDLRIDEPQNKSGRVNNPRYPFFSSRENSYVYYDAGRIQKGVYDRESFFFEVQPFEMDSLDNFSRGSLKFPGKFHSGGIFPPIDQVISLQRDRSLGFDFNTGAEGLPAYGGQGKVMAELKLNNTGFTGKGTFEYITSTTWSDQFFFYPDSTRALAKNFEIKRQVSGVQYPQVTCQGNVIHFLPNQQEFFAFQKEGPFNMFNPQTSLHGTLKLTPAGLYGNGRMDLTTAELTSSFYSYQADVIAADTSNFRLKSVHKPGFTVITNNVNSRVDFARRNGTFTSNDDYTLVQFPENLYVSYLDYFNWKMDAKELEMGLNRPMDKGKHGDSGMKLPSSADDGLSGPRYISLHPRQDSLSFVSPLATYDYEENLLKASNVEFIRVADAMVYPNKGNVVVEENAKMRSLDSATLIVNHLTKLHRLHTSSINVLGRYQYNGSGYYDYIDENEDVQQVFFSEIKTQPDYTTVATGNILEPDNFTLSPHFAYHGKVTLTANQPFLHFNGGVKVAQPCEWMGSDWLQFQSEINPLDILIPVSNTPVNINLRRVYLGNLLAVDSTHVYSRFFGNRKVFNDIPVLSAEGFLNYSKDSLKYQVGLKENIRNNFLPGNYFSFYNKDCRTRGEGDINLGVELGQLKLSGYGNTRHELQKNDFTLEMVMNMNFFMHPPVLQMMAQEIDSFPGLQPFDLNHSLYTRAMIQALGDAGYKKLSDERLLYGKARELPPQVIHTIQFTSLKLRWNSATRSYQSYGPIGIGNIGNYQVNKTIEGYVEIVKRRSGDFMDVYLKLDDRNWYYFGYTRGVMQTLSSNSSYNQMIMSLPEKSRKMKVQRRETPYLFMLAPDQRFATFLRGIRDKMEKKDEQILEQEVQPAEPPVQEIR